jgi:hypothetical protein
MAYSFTDDEWVSAFQVKVFGALRMMRVWQDQGSVTAGETRWEGYVSGTRARTR